MRNDDTGPAPSQLIGQRVRARRRELGLTQEQLASHAHVAVSTVRVIEGGGRAKYQPTTLKAIGGALWGNPNALLPDEDDDAELTFEDRLGALEGQMAEVLDRIEAIEGQLAIRGAA